MKFRWWAFLALFALQISYLWIEWRWSCRGNASGSYGSSILYSSFLKISPAWILSSIRSISSMHPSVCLIFGESAIAPRKCHQPLTRRWFQCIWALEVVCIRVLGNILRFLWHYICLRKSLVGFNCLLKVVINSMHAACDLDLLHLLLDILLLFQEFEFIL